MFNVENFNAQMWWQGISTFLGCPPERDPAETDIGMVGIPYCGGNPITRMQYLAPRELRSASMGFHRAHRRFGVDPFALCRIRDMGDTPIPNVLVPEKAMVDIQSFFEPFDTCGTIPVSVGGDHSVTLPVLRAIAGTNSRHRGPIAMIHLDAHTDCCPLELGGTKLHAGPFYRLAEEGLIDPKKTIQIGIRGQMADLTQDDWARDLGFRILGTDEFLEIGVKAVIEETRRVVGDGPVFISWDMDALDPIYAPAVSDPEADGLSMRDCVALLNGLRGLDIVGADVVEFCPTLDAPNMLTVLHATHIFHEIVTLVADSIATRRAVTENAATVQASTR